MQILCHFMRTLSIMDFGNWILGVPELMSLRYPGMTLLLQLSRGWLDSGRHFLALGTVGH